MKTDVDDIIFSDITNVISDLELECGGAVVVSWLLILQIVSWNCIYKDIDFTHGVKYNLFIFLRTC